MGELIRDRYEPLEVVGRGGQGEVLRALDRLHDRPVALKVREVGGDREAVLSEARILLGLKPHPGVTLVREDFFLDDGRYVLVMDWISGRDLRTVLDEEGRLPGERACEVLGQVANALDHLHAHDPPITHKDVKPENILLTEDDRAVLVDFGVAQGRGAYEDAGTGAYLAPEVARGEITPAADVFALAVVAHELLTGVHPWRSERAPSRTAGAHQDRVRAALEAGMAVDPERRPASATELVADLDPRKLAAPNNLPVHNTSFVGRQRELAEVTELLGVHRLVTLTGVGGAGKTRLVLESAARVMDRFPDGVFFVDLASLRDADLVARGVVEAIASGSGGGLTGPGSQSVEDLLDDRTCLLVLDNCEHLLGGCAELAERILSACPQVRIVSTSREPLEVAGEQVYRVPSLTVPEEGAEIGSSEAVALFVDRAASVRSDFELTPDDAPVVAHICCRLDGIPLAVEFAAARVGHLSVAQIAERLDDRFRLLTWGPRRAQRQQTLEAALDWSHDLLDEPERVLLRRLAVFSGTFGLEMAEETCCGDGIERTEVLDLLASLVGKSLVVTEPTPQEMRYRLLETVRSYAAAKLAAAGETEAMRSRHRDTYLTWLESTSWSDIYAASTIREAMAREFSNIRAALEWSQAQDRRDLVGRIAARAVAHWWAPARAEEGQRWLRWALEEPESLDRGTRAACLLALAEAERAVGDLGWDDHAAQALELGRDVLGGPVVRAFGLRAFGMAIRSIAAGDPEAASQARALAEDGVRAAEPLGGPWPVIAFIDHAYLALILTDVAAGERSYRSAVERMDGEHPYLPVVSGLLGTCRVLLGDAEGGLDAARTGILAQRSRGEMGIQTHLPAALAEACLGRLSEAGRTLESAIGRAEVRAPLQINQCLAFAGAMAYEIGDPRTASRLLAAAVSVGAAGDGAMPFQEPGSFNLHVRYRSLVRGALSREEIRRCRSEGEAMSVDDAVTAILDLAAAMRGADSTEESIPN